MTASSYMTRTDTQTFWDATLDSTRYDLVAVRIAEQLNFWVNHDATSQVTDIRVTPILEQISEEILLEIIQASKSYAVEKPWDFIRSNVSRISRKILSTYGILLEEIRLTLTKQYHYTETDRYSYGTGEGGLIKRTV